MRELFQEALASRRARPGNHPYCPTSVNNSIRILKATCGFASRVKRPLDVREFLEILHPKTVTSTEALNVIREAHGPSARPMSPWHHTRMCHLEDYVQYKAVGWLRKRAELDTDNARWQMVTNIRDQHAAWVSRMLGASSWSSIELEVRSLPPIVLNPMHREPR